MEPQARARRPADARALAVERWGSGGRPLLLLHGIGGSSRYWHGLVAACPDHRTTAPDLLGFGRSPRPADSPYDVEVHLQRLLPLVEPGSVVVAHSTGAVLAAALAVRHPERVAALLLVGAPLYPDAARARREVRRLGPLARVTVSGELRGRLVMAVLHGLVAPVSPWLPLGLPRPVVEDFWEHSWRSYSRTLRRVVVEHPAVPDLQRVPVPTTLLYGTGDEVAPRDALADLLPRPGWEHVEVPGDHHLPARRPEAVAAALRRLLARTPVPRQPL